MILRHEDPVVIDFVANHPDIYNTNMRYMVGRREHGRVDWNCALLITPNDYIFEYIETMKRLYPGVTVEDLTGEIPL